MIRRILLLVLLPVLAISTISCEDLEDNTPAFQVMVNGELFKAKEMQIATEEDGGYMLTGVDETSMLEIYLSNITEGSHSFGETSQNILTFSNATGTFTTAIENGGGELLLTGSSVLEDITGTFHFRAADTSGARMHGTNGHIYQLPFGDANMELPDFEVEDGGEFSVNGEMVHVTAVEAAEGEGMIAIEILGAEDRRVAIQVPETIEAGVVTLPSTEENFVYYVGGETFTVVSGSLEIEIHDRDSRVLKASFQVETEGEHEVVGSFRVTY
ncbi:MAG TPA: DUF6252 family protein [Flavobacteriaceae bacterium]|nr:DUF6252 family protein [Flavobacteriaceae bacterium]